MYVALLREEITNLRVIPSEIRFLTDLRILDRGVDEYYERYDDARGFNPLYAITVLKTKRNIQSIPDEIGYLTELKYLTLCKSTTRFATQVMHENLKRFSCFETKRWY